MDNNQIKIALIGYGSMGKKIEELTKNDPVVSVSNIFDIDSKISASGDYEFDVAIDFSFPDQMFDNLKTVAQLGKNHVIGTTGWYDQVDEVKKIVVDAGIGCIWASNFSIGVNMFFKIIEHSSKLLNKVNGFDIFAHELHHIRKKDSPSGTAHTIASIITDNVDAKTTLVTNKIDGNIKPEELHFSSTRGGEVTGTHSVYIDSISDSIELTHRAKNRIGFASGALEAAKWIHGKKGFYNITEMLDSVWKDLK